MKINGQNPGGYHPRLAFAAAINVEGTKGVTIKGVTITNPFGTAFRSPRSGAAPITSRRDPQRLDQCRDRRRDHPWSGPPGVTLASVSGAQISDLVVENSGLNTFDVEADQGNEGATDVTIDGCTSSGRALLRQRRRWERDVHP